MHSFVLPRKWRLLRLAKIADLKNGGTPAKARTEFWDGGDIPFVTAADLTSLYVEEGRSFLTEAALHSGKTVICEPGDILIGTRTRVGNCSIPRRLMGASQDVTRARFKIEVIVEYFCWFFRNISDYLSFYSQGTSIQGITRGMLNDLEIPVPPLEEQRRIEARIKALTERADEARKILREAEEELATFTPSLLTKAFRGEL
jgi:type I restriction enzyme S subunit